MSDNWEFLRRYVRQIVGLLAADDRPLARGSYSTMRATR